MSVAGRLVPARGVANAVSTVVDTCCTIRRTRASCTFAQVSPIAQAHRMVPAAKTPAPDGATQ